MYRLAKPQPSFRQRFSTLVVWCRDLLPRVRPCLSSQRSKHTWINEIFIVLIWYPANLSLLKILSQLLHPHQRKAAVHPAVQIAAILFRSYDSLNVLIDDAIVVADRLSIPAYNA